MQDVIYTILYIVKNFGNIFFRILSFFTVAKIGKSFKSIKSALMQGQIRIAFLLVQVKPVSDLPHCFILFYNAVIDIFYRITTIICHKKLFQNQKVEISGGIT